MTSSLFNHTGPIEAKAAADKKKARDKTRRAMNKQKADAKKKGSFAEKMPPSFKPYTRRSNKPINQAKPDKSSHKPVKNLIPVLTTDEYSALIALIDRSLNDIRYSVAKPPFGLGLVALGRLRASLEDQARGLLTIRAKLEGGAVHVA